MSKIVPARLRTLLKRFSGEQAGSVAMLLGLMFLVLVGCMGFSIDAGRAFVVRARLVDALDSAGLAVGARTTTTAYTADAKRYVAANFKANYAGATVTDVTATPNADGSVITLTAKATMPTAFMRIFGVREVTVNATSEITRETNGLELAMVLDNTGSMEISSSMGALKTAAKGLVNDLFNGKVVAENLYIGLVPFSQAVNIGTSETSKDWTDLKKVTRKYYPDTWTGCVEARRNGFDQTDDPPATSGNARFTAYYSPDIYRGIFGPNNDWIKTNSQGKEYADIRYVNYQLQQGPGAYCPQPMTGLTNVKSKVTAGIDNMTAAGSTMINLGAIWGWRMLSPRWRGWWAEPEMLAFNLPLDYGTKKMSKAMILMTDGENSFTGGNYTAYGTLEDGRLGTTNQTAAEGVLNTRLAAVCNAMKAKGIMVITVAYDNPNAATKTLLQNCATNLSLYFDAANTAGLATSFKLIAGVLSSLRVSK